MGAPKEELAKDEKTVRLMTLIYCKAHHQQERAELRHNELCPECENLVQYALERTARCPHEHKGNCEDCSIHCYRPEKRAAIRATMAYAGPRIFFTHPIIAARYLNKKRKRTAVRTNLKPERNG